MASHVVVVVVVVGHFFLSACAPPTPSAATLSPSCSTCHPTHAAAHAASRHARAATSEVFVALRARADDAWKAGAFCDGCHLPVGGTDVGLGCLTCHASAGNLGRGDGTLIFEPDAPVKASFTSGRAPHPVQVTGFTKSADLCGTCHDVEGPGPFRESPFAHWQASPAGMRNQTCADCHLSSTPGVPDEAPGTHHRPVGLLSESEAAQALLSRALRLEIEEVRVTSAGRAVTVALESRAEGHHVPDGASFLRAIWVDASGDGWASASAPEGAPVAGDPRWLSARMFKGEAEVADPTRADRAEPRGLAPGARRQYHFEVPATGRLEVCVRFRRYRVDLLIALGLPPSLAGPTVAVTCVEVS